MGSVNVSTKKELAKALKEKQPEIIITDEKLAKQIKELAGIKKISKKTIIILCAIGAAAGAVATGVTIASGGSAGPVAYPIATKIALAAGGAAAGGAATGGAATGLSGAAIVALAALGVGFSLSAIALLKNYDVSFDASTGHLRLLLKKKIEKDAHIA